MATDWLLLTHGNPLETVRQFLLCLWEHSQLEGMLVPCFEPDTGGIISHLVTQPGELKATDPFSPLVAGNAARQVIEISRQRPDARYVAVLRPCEALALERLSLRQQVDLREWLVIGVDCLASFPSKDFHWRLKRAGGSEALTYQMLQSARQGGIAPYRFRGACQLCDHPSCQSADLVIGFVGLEVKEYVLLIAKDEDTVRCLGLHHTTDGPAPGKLSAQRAQAISKLCQRRMRASQRQISKLPAGMPATFDQLLEMWAGCAPCQECMQACPVYAGELEPVYQGSPFQREGAYRWLQDCFSCGLCDEACPKQIPISSLISRLAYQPVAF